MDQSEVQHPHQYDTTASSLKNQNKNEPKMHLTYSLPLLSSILFTAIINAEPFKCNPPTIQPINTVQVPFCCEIALLGVLGLPSATGVGCTYIIPANEFDKFRPCFGSQLIAYRRFRNRKNLPERPDSLLLLGGGKYFGFPLFP